MRDVVGDGDASSTRLGELGVPTLVAHGAHDDLFPLAWAERAAETVPDADLHVFDECAHWPPREAPDECVDTLASFLSGRGPRTRSTGPNPGDGAGIRE